MTTSMTLTIMKMMRMIDTLATLHTTLSCDVMVMYVSCLGTRGKFSSTVIATSSDLTDLAGEPAEMILVSSIALSAKKPKGIS